MNFHSRNAPARQRKNQGGGAHMPVEQEKDAAALECLGGPGCRALAGGVGCPQNIPARQ